MRELDLELQGDLTAGQVLLQNAPKFSDHGVLRRFFSAFNFSRWKERRFFLTL